MAKQEIRDATNQLAKYYFENKHGKKVDINELIADDDFYDCSLSGYFYVKNDVDYVDIQTLEKFELSLTLNLLC